MLTEDHAFALLEHHCAPSRHSTCVIGTDFMRCSDWRAALNERVDWIVGGLWISREDDMRLVGARLRVAVTVTHAVSCCRGFEPDVNVTFWRRIVPTWSKQTRVAGPERIALSPTAFQHIGIESWSDVDSINAFWTGFLHGTPESVTTLAAVLDDLRPHFHVVAPMSPLYVSLSHCHTDNGSSTIPQMCLRSCVTQAGLSVLLEAALRPRPSAKSWSVVAHVGLVVECCADYDASTMRATLDLLFRAYAHAPPHLRFTIDRLDVQLEPLVPPKILVDSVQYRRALATRCRVLGETLWRTLVDANRPFPVHTVALLDCSYSDFRLVGTALSAVALASHPVQELRCGRLFDVTTPCHHLQRLAWLAFALQCRHRQSSVPLALSLRSTGMTITEHESEYMQILMARGTLLRDVVGEALRLRCGGDDELVARLTVECLRLGSSIRLARGSRLFVEPFRVDNDSVLVVTKTEEELEWVAHVSDYGGCVGVVYGGYGLVWVDASAVTARHRQDDDVVMTDTTDDHVTLSSLALGFDGVESVTPALQSDAYRVAAMLPLLACQSLTSLSIDNAVILESDLVQLLAACRFLEDLVLDRCLIESLEPLVSAYAAGTTRIAALSLVGAYDLRLRDAMVSDRTLFCVQVRDNEDHGTAAWTASLVDALACGVARGVLRELKIDVMGMASVQTERKAVEQLADAVASSALSLKRLHVSCRRDVYDTCAARLGPLHGVVLADPPRVRCAILSILTRVGCPLREVATLVLALAEGAVVRTVACDSLRLKWM